MELGRIKKYNIYYYLIILLVCVSTVLFSVLFFIFNEKSQLNLDKSIKQSVVEVKAATDDVGESFGSAVFVKDDGTLITNAHVVTYKKLGEQFTFENISIRFSTETAYRAVTLIKYDLQKDLAVLKLNDVNCNFSAIAFAESSLVQFGEEVYAIGNLNNIGISLTKGIISNPKIVVSYNEQSREVIQCDLAIAEGNSGGALLNSDGKLIGITTFRLKDNSGNVIYGISYCIPADVVMEYINLL
ncbi:MAG: trypsin-like peptidase domain-containing protein [Clostridia bacterium]|nr:trypsin-like peptidase domain-containing protein [Clostridia bacterium]